MPTRDEVIAELTASGPFEQVEDTSLGYPIRIYRNAPPSLRDVLKTTAAYGDRTFLIYEDETLTFREHYGKVAALAQRLLDAGVVKGDRVAIGMRNYPEWSISWWACQAIGAIAVALNAWWTGPELEFALRDATPTALLIDGERLERIADLLPTLGVKLVLVARRGAAGPGGEDFADAVAAPLAELPDADVGPLDLATILYTSGTTGNPKGAMATHRNHVTNLLNTMLGGAVARSVAGLPPPPADAPQPGSLQTFPFFHIGGLTGLYVATALGSKIALMYKWVPHEAVRLVETHRLSSVAGVPIVVRQLLETARNAGASMDSLIGVASGGAPVPPDLIRTIGEQFHEKASPGNGYGLTETTSAIIANGGPDYLAHPDSVGRPTANTDVRIVGDDGEDLGVGHIGELWVRGPNIIPGYWRNPEATEAAFGGGWFRTGDLGLRDEAGLYYVVDRKKDVIIRGGENVYCAEVEALLLEHPKVRDAAVVGLPHRDYGEEVGAVIQVAATDLDDSVGEQIRQSLENRLARFKIPTTIKLTDGDLPRTATGKILKRELRSNYF
ncbi:MAG TPA: class I adenylate-forming enzyme family protein [Caulobacteraceae bacterium]|jgi:long-chain acyl-CoA synthetase|nr:class I adenylate-forming enzyme family protein [Caulobacteraceae bacterium]